MCLGPVGVSIFFTGDEVKCVPVHSKAFINVSEVVSWKTSHIVYRLYVSNNEQEYPIEAFSENMEQMWKLAYFTCIRAVRRGFQVHVAARTWLRCLSPRMDLLHESTCQNTHRPTETDALTHARSYGKQYVGCARPFGGATNCVL